jgi:TPR repeat protein
MPSLLQQGIYFYNKYEYKQAFKYFMRSASLDIETPQDKAKSLWYIGHMFKLGLGVPVSVDHAIKFFKQSAKEGYVYSMFILGIIYEKGKLVPQDYKEAIVWYTQGANLGDSSCQINLGCMYDAGRGTSVNFEKAYECFKKAYDQGDIDATYNIGTMYEHGEYLPKNKVKAYRNYCDAGEYNIMDRVAALEVVEESKLRLCEYERSNSKAGKYNLPETLEQWIHSNIPVQ